MTLARLALPFRAAANAGPASTWQWNLRLVSVGALAILLLFAPDAWAMASIWVNASTYNHCALVVLLVGWSVWQRRSEIAPLTPVVWLPGLGFTALGAFLWFLGDAASVALFRQAALIVMLQSLVPLLLGWQVARALTFPLFYLLFAIPFGEELLPVLQTLTAHISIQLLHLAAVPAFLNGIFISTPNGYYKVAEACAGAKFLLAMLAYGALVANVCFRSWHRRAAFMMLCAILPVLANGVRAFATIYVGYRTSPEIAGGFDHLVYGWIFFALVMVATIGIGLPFFERRAGDPWVSAVATPKAASKVAPGSALGALLLLPLAVLGWSAAGRAITAERLTAPISLPVVPGWTQRANVDQIPWTPRYEGADQLLLGHYENAQGQIVTLCIALYGHQSEGRELVGYGQGAAGREDDPWSWSQSGPAFENARSEILTAPGAVQRLAVTFFYSGGELTGSAASVKLSALQARLLLKRAPAAAVLFSAQGDGKEAQSAVSSFRAAIGPVETVAQNALASAGR